MGLHLAPFKASADFKAAKNFRYAGRAVVKDTLIDKSQVDEGKLKLLYESHYIVPATDDEVEAAGGAPGALTDDQTKRVEELVAGNDREALNTLASSPPLNIAEPEKMGTKADVATAIVRAETPAA